jgi:hypothetical protein
MSEVRGGSVAEGDDAVAYSAGKSGCFLGVCVFKTAVLGVAHGSHERQVNRRAVEKGKCVAVYLRCMEGVG